MVEIRCCFESTAEVRHFLSEAEREDKEDSPMIILSVYDEQMVKGKRKANHRSTQYCHALHHPRDRYHVHFLLAIYSRISHNAYSHNAYFS